MTVTDIRPAESTATPESQNLARLRAMLEDPAQREHWDDIRQAIEYLIGDTFVQDLAA